MSIYTCRTAHNGPLSSTRERNFTFFSPLKWYIILLVKSVNNFLAGLSIYLPVLCTMIVKLQRWLFSAVCNLFLIHSVLHASKQVFSLIIQKALWLIITIGKMIIVIITKVIVYRKLMSFIVKSCRYHYIFKAKALHTTCNH